MPVDASPCAVESVWRMLGRRPGAPHRGAAVRPLRRAYKNGCSNASLQILPLDAFAGSDPTIAGSRHRGRAPSGEGWKPWRAPSGRAGNPGRCGPGRVAPPGSNAPAGVATGPDHARALAARAIARKQHSSGQSPGRPASRGSADAPRGSIGQGSAPHRRRACKADCRVAAAREERVRRTGGTRQPRDRRGVPEGRTRTARRASRRRRPRQDPRGSGTARAAGQRRGSGIG